MSELIHEPTPYCDVNALLAELLERTQAILGEQLVGMYLFGSLANGDFDRDSDIDALMVTEDAITEDRFAALKAMHSELATQESVWATQLEVSYIPKQALRRYDPADSLHPHLDRGTGEVLHWMTHDTAWIVQRSVLRERGVVVSGPAPETLIDPISADELRSAMLGFMPGWTAHILSDPATITHRGYQSYVVLSLCRILYTFERGTIVSKPVAARWAEQTLSSQWKPLIERAWEGRQNPGLTADTEDVNGTLAFIRYALERAEEFKALAESSQVEKDEKE